MTVMNDEQQLWFNGAMAFFTAHKTALQPVAREEGMGNHPPGNLWGCASKHTVTWQCLQQRSAPRCSSHLPRSPGEFK